MRRLVFLLVLFVLALKADVVSELNLEDKKLEKRIVSFWKHYSELKAEEMYALEAPYFRYLYSFDNYKAYVKTIYKPKRVVLRKIKTNNDIISVEVILSILKREFDYVDRLSEVRIFDKWIVYDGKYYHKTEHFLIFPE
jgi:hypothetical protein